jgi:hypothetical protein
MKYFKVQKGYGSDDFISIDETELRKAMVAQVKGQVAIFKEGTVSGNSIVSITPDWNRTMGYHRDYKLTGEDYTYIGEKRVEESRKLLENTLNEIMGRQSAIEAPEQNDMVKELANKFKLN